VRPSAARRRRSASVPASSTRRLGRSAIPYLDPPLMELLDITIAKTAS
jgi:hypothetical protein